MQQVCFGTRPKRHNKLLLVWGLGVRWGRGKVTGIEGCACTVRVRVRKILVSIINDD